MALTKNDVKWSVTTIGTLHYYLSKMFRSIWMKILLDVDNISLSERSVSLVNNKLVAESFEKKNITPTWDIFKGNPAKKRFEVLFFFFSFKMLQKGYLFAPSCVFVASSQRAWHVFTSLRIHIKRVVTCSMTFLLNWVLDVEPDITSLSWNKNNNDENIFVMLYLIR